MCWVSRRGTASWRATAHQWFASSLRCRRGRRRWHAGRPAPGRLLRSAVAAFPCPWHKTQQQRDTSCCREGIERGVPYGRRSKGGDGWPLGDRGRPPGVMPPPSTPRGGRRSPPTGSATGGAHVSRGSCRRLRVAPLAAGSGPCCARGGWERRRAAAWLGRQISSSSPTARFLGGEDRQTGGGGPLGSSCNGLDGGGQCPPKWAAHTGVVNRRDKTTLYKHEALPK